MSRLPANRSSLLRLRQRLARVDRGADLLRRKRESLVAQLLGQAKPAIAAREQIEARAQEAYRALFTAGAEMGETGLGAVAWPSRELYVEIESERAWGLPVARLTTLPVVQRSLPVRGTFPGNAGSAVLAGRRFEVLVDALLKAATEEQLLRRLGRAVRDTARRVNALERRVGTTMRHQVRALSQTLEEREREENFRLKRIMASHRAAKDARNRVRG